VLERQPGADTEGYAGLEDEVDNHWGMLFRKRHPVAGGTIPSHAPPRMRVGQVIVARPAINLSAMKPPA
jgi:hypothetical protein